MSKVRRVTLLEEMFKDVASPQEMFKVDELYRLNHKGSAVVYMVKRVKRQWDAMLGKPSEVEPLVKPRTVKINEGGQSRLSVMR